MNSHIFDQPKLQQTSKDIHKDNLFFNEKRNFYKKKSSQNIFLDKLFNRINYTIIILIFFFSFISIDAQGKWTDFYVSLIETRTFNNNLIDMISQTEEFYLREIELEDIFKNTTSRDLIYLNEPRENYKNYFFDSIYKNIIEGLKDSNYQMGY
tara:strand:- start:4634 stop:5092 length:459 start_codon:yes stop_codon:yes gene_type:complete